MDWTEAQQAHLQSCDLVRPVGKPLWVDTYTRSIFSCGAVVAILLVGRDYVQREERWDRKRRCMAERKEILGPLYITIYTAG